MNRERPWQPISTAPEGRRVLTAIIDASGERNTQHTFDVEGGVIIEYH